MYKIKRVCDKVENIEVFLNVMEEEGWKVIECSFYYDSAWFKRSDKVRLNVLFHREGKGPQELKKGFFGKTVDSFFSGVNDNEDGEED